ncbi:hypothetical protein HAHE_32700 [Haloferula helveola]|uniref:RNA polymerase sigma-70 factor, ECF subfamily n=1 Tax=Haloferula helveola TaxID=490095 RepID=A0ABM7RCD9_9BACT|nr:hypothetical protein HAHE_32700 [Haloferula helveola]
MAEDPTPATSELLRSWLGGDDSAAEELVERLHPLVAKIVNAHLPRREQVNDLLQEIFAKVFSRASQFKETSPLEHWVARIAVSTCRDRLRHHSRRPHLLWSELSPDEQLAYDRFASDASAVLLSPDEARSLLERLLSRLPVAERALVVWLDLEERPIAEVSDLTGAPAGLVRVRAFRARQRLRQIAASLPKDLYLP